MRYALLFPGQASQHVGMGAELRAASAAAEEVFALADRATGLPIAAACREGPLELLTRTEYAQPAVIAASLAALRVLRERLATAGKWLAPAFCAGHSVGELAALSAAGALSEEQALRLVARRSRHMAAACEAVDSTMAAVLGADLAALESACRSAAEATGTLLQVANLNAPDQLVVSGHRAAVDWLAERARALGLRRVVPLKVAGAFHSGYVRGAAVAFARDVADVPITQPAVPVVLNQTATPTTDPDEIRRELSEQIASPVRWSASLDVMAAAGCRLFVEVGPGQVLAGLVKRSVPGAQAVAAGDLAGIDRAIELLTTEEAL